MRGSIAKGLLIAVLSLGGCAVNPNGSWVDGIESDDSAVLAKDMGAYIGTLLPPGKATIAVLQDQGSGGSPVGADLEAVLRSRGFAIAQSDQAPAGTHQVRYIVSPSSLGVGVRLITDGNEVTRLYGRTSTGLIVAAGPFVVRQ
jgi:hypothetical protein